MLSQIRIYTINKGEMDNFLKHFKEEITPLHERIGVPIGGTRVNRPQKDKADLEAKGKAFQAEVAKSGSSGIERREDGSPRGRIGVCVEERSERHGWLNRCCEGAFWPSH